MIHSSNILIGASFSDLAIATKTAAGSRYRVLQKVQSKLAICDGQVSWGDRRGLKGGMAM